MICLKNQTGGTRELWVARGTYIDSTPNGQVGGLLLPDFWAKKKGRDMCPGLKSKL
jgi:hypothetical protein